MVSLLLSFICFNSLSYYTQPSHLHSMASMSSFSFSASFQIPSPILCIRSNSGTYEFVHHDTEYNLISPSVIRSSNPSLSSVIYDPNTHQYGRLPVTALPRNVIGMISLISICIILLGKFTNFICMFQLTILFHTTLTLTS